MAIRGGNIISYLELDTGKYTADYVIFDKTKTAVFKAHLTGVGRDKATTVEVSAPEGVPEWVTVARLVKHGAFNTPGCPPKE